MTLCSEEFKGTPGFSTDCGNDSECQINIQYLCCITERQEGTELVQNSTNIINIVLLNVYLIVFAFINLYLTFLMYRNKNLQAHPMKLFILMALADCIYLSNLFFAQQYCRFGLDYLYAWTIRWDGSSYIRNWAMTKELPA